MTGHMTQLQYRVICNPGLVATGHNWWQLVATSPVAVLPFWADKKYQSSPDAFQKRQKNRTGLDFETLFTDRRKASNILGLQLELYSATGLQEC